MREFLTRYDAFAAPVTQVPPFSVEDEYPRAIAGVAMGSYLEWFRSCSRITVTSHPAVAVPAGFTDDGLPIGLQLVGRHRGEAALLRLARAFTEATGLAARAARALMPWPTTPPTAAHRAAFADAEPHSFWLATAAEPRAGAGGRDRGRPVHRRRRLHRAVGGAAREGRRPGARRRRARGRDRRLRRQRAQRRLLRRLAHARDRERARALRRRDGGARAARAGELRRPARRPRSARHRLRLRADRRAARARPTPTRSRGSRRSARCSSASATR